MNEIKKVIKFFAGSFSLVGAIGGACINAHIQEIEDFCKSKLEALDSQVVLYVFLFLISLFIIISVGFLYSLIILYKQGKKISKQIEGVLPDISVASIKACVVHHRTLKTWERIKNAQNEVILHAAYYPQYGYNSDYSNAFLSLMRSRHTVKITVIISDIESIWAREFGKILRYEYDTIEKFREGIDSSIVFFKKLREDFPGRVEIKTSSRLPLMPFVIIDNDILVGHYCHATIPAPNGLWLHLNSEKVKEIIEKVRYEKEEEKKRYIGGLTDEEQAIARYIEDAFDSYNNGKDV